MEKTDEKGILDSFFASVLFRVRNNVVHIAECTKNPDKKRALEEYIADNLLRLESFYKLIDIEPFLLYVRYVNVKEIYDRSGIKYRTKEATDLISSLSNSISCFVIDECEDISHKDIDECEDISHKDIDTTEFVDEVVYTQGKEDPINPSHYKRDGVELIQITEQLDFCKGNSIKYIFRSGKKRNKDTESLAHSELQDLEKAKWYIDRSIKNVQKVIDNAKEYKK